MINHYKKLLFYALIGVSLIVPVNVRATSTAQALQSGPAPQKPNLWNVSPPNPNFMGRESTLKKIVEIFSNGESLLILTGGAGFGKTQLAKQYAHRVKQQYDLVWWFHVEDTLNAQIEEFAHKLNTLLPSQEKLEVNKFSPEKLWEAVQDKLYQKQMKCFFIFDNADELEAIASYLSFLPNVQSQILITSRKKITPYATLPIEAFSRAESLAYLRKTLPHTPEKDRIHLAQKLVDHPLALALAASFIRFTPDMSANKYLASKPQKAAPQFVFADQYRCNLDTAIRLTLQSLKERSLPTFKAIQFLSLLHYSQIPFSLVERWLQHKFVKEKATDILRMLYDRSLIDIPADSKSALSIHPLVHQVIFEQLSNTEKASLLSEAIAVLEVSFRGKAEDISRRILQNQAIFWHANRVSGVAQKLQYHSIPLLSLRIRILHFLLGGLREFEQAKKLIEIIERDYKESEEYVSESMWPFSVLTTPRLSREDKILYETDRGFFEAVYSVDQAKSLFHSARALKMLEDTRSACNDKLRVIANMLQVYTLGGQLEQAHRLLDKSKPLFQTCESPIRQMAFVLAHTGLLTIQGRFQESLDLLKKHRPLLEKLKGHPPSQMAFMRAHAENLAHLGQQAECESILQKLEEMIRNFYNNREPPILATVMLLRVLSHIQERNGQTGEQDIIHLQKALKIYAQAWHGENKYPYQGLTHFVMGHVYEKDGKLEDALRAYQEAEKVYDGILKTIQIEAISLIYTAIATVALRLKQRELALTYLRKHFKVFGLNHSRTRKVAAALYGHKS